MAKPTVAIVGRPNVGKSTLFNRLVGHRISIVDDTPGVTRDRIYATAEWCGREFSLIDTGGIVNDDEEVFPALVREQVNIAIHEADVIIFLMDVMTGVLDDDMIIASMLRQSGKKVIPVINKTDNQALEMEVPEFYKVGLGDPVSISSQHALGIGDLLDEVIAGLPISEEEEEDDSIKVAVVGRPNVGKSSLVNRLIGADRSIVSDIAGTTRDAIDSKFEKDGHKYVFIDTAGLRRKARISESIERYSVMRAIRAIERCDTAIIVIDANDGVTAQDQRIAGLAEDAGKSCIIVVNKWDTVSKDNSSVNEFTKMLRIELDFIKFAPILFISAKTGQRVDKIFDLVVQVSSEHARRIQTSELNSLVREMVMMHNPPTDKGRQLKILYASQVSVKPPHFAFFVNDEDLMHFSYLRYLLNGIREAYGFIGTPVRTSIRGRKK